jgi:thioredoxin 1
MSNFGELIDANVPVLINFFTRRNEDTLPMDTVLRNVAAALGDKAKIIIIEIEKNQKLSDALCIKRVPTFIIFKKGEMKWRQTGPQDEHTLIHKIQSYY